MTPDKKVVESENAAQIGRGTIVYYNNNLGTGFIRPDNSPGNNSISIDWKNSRHPRERTVGDVVLEDSPAPLGGFEHINVNANDLRVGRRVVFYRQQTSDHRWFSARLWTTETEWDRCVHTLEIRPNPEQPLTRAYRFAEDHRTKIIVWEGFLDRLAEAVRVGEPFLKLEDLHFEWRLAEGWKPLPDVRDDYFSSLVPLSETGKDRSMRFYLALLIEQGLSIFRRDNKEAGAIDLWEYTSIGRARRTSGVHNLWGLTGRLPYGNPGILRTYYGVGLQTNLPPLFLSCVFGASHRINDREKQAYAISVIRDLREGRPVGLCNSSDIRQERQWMNDYATLVQRKSNKALVLPQEPESR